jgi:putative DNA primase/helicase
MAETEHVINDGNGIDAYTAAALEAGAECLAKALDYLARGWPPLALCPPDHAGIALVNKKHAAECKQWGKVPWHSWKDYQLALPTEAVVRGWWRSLATSNVGMTLGGISRLIGLDIDGAAGEELLRRLSAGDEPPTLEFASGKGRRPLYRVPAGVELRPTPRPGGLEVEGGELRLLGLGSQTVMPPSRHKDGRRYTWLPGRGPGEIEPAVAPAWVVALMRADAPAKGKAAARTTPLEEGELIPERKRNTALTSLAGTMRRRGLTAAEMLPTLLAVNARRCDQPLEDSEVEGIAASVGRYAPGNVPLCAARPAPPRHGHVILTSSREVR